MASDPRTLKLLYATIMDTFKKMDCKERYGLIERVLGTYCLHCGEKVIRTQCPNCDFYLEKTNSTDGES